MVQALVYYNNILAGTLTEENRQSYIFKYDDTYYQNPLMPAISLGLPKNKREYHSEYMFPCFSNMLPEGVNLDIQSRYLKIDKEDVMSLLITTSGSDTIGAITIKPLENGI